MGADGWLSSTGAVLDHCCNTQFLKIIIEKRNISKTLKDPSFWSEETAHLCCFFVHLFPAPQGSEDQSWPILFLSLWIDVFSRIYVDYVWSEVSLVIFIGTLNPLCSPLKSLAVHLLSAFLFINSCAEFLESSFAFCISGLGGWRGDSFGVVFLFLFKTREYPVSRLFVVFPPNPSVLFGFFGFAYLRGCTALILDWNMLSYSLQDLVRTSQG